MEPANHSVDDVPGDFMIVDISQMRSRRYVRKQKDDWNVFQWNGHWVFFDNYGDDSVLREYRLADYVFVAHKKPQEVTNANA
jgi:hypothetical protein